MKIYSDFSEIQHINNPILTIGTFDGVHIGHQKIIQKLNEEAENCGGESVLFTFYPHPRMVLNPDVNLQLIQTQEEKLAKLERMGLKHLIVFPFTKDFANTKAEDFIVQYLINQLQVKKVVIGYDHQFGKNREGSIEQFRELAKQYQFEVIEIPAQEINEINISSTKIREAILQGDAETATNFLNEPFELTGTVVHGKKLGNQIGFPTANIQLANEHKIVPKTGVYAVELILDNATQHGMMNIGFRPTVSDEKTLSIEVHLFDFKQDLYEKQLIVRLIHRIRDEQKFDGIESLIQQLKQDEIACRTLFHLV
jgi:riboflavin kinase / FMN adenylyltransferase